MRTPIFILFLSGLALSEACVKAISHNQDTAAIEAVQIAKIAIINRDYERARTRLAFAHAEQNFYS